MILRKQTNCPFGNPRREGLSEYMISIKQPVIAKLAEPYPLEKLLASPAPTVWASVPRVPKRPNLVNTLKLPPGLIMGGHTLSPVAPTPNSEEMLKEVLKSLGEIELPHVEGEFENVHVVLSATSILSELISPTQKTTFETLIFYPERLLPVVQGVLDLVAASHPALQATLQKVKPGLNAVAFVIKTTKGVYTLICELKTRKLPKP